jgi:hypothetical protein
MGARESKKQIKHKAEERLEEEGEIPTSEDVDVTETVIHPPAGTPVKPVHQNPKPLTKRQQDEARKAAVRRGERPEGVTDEEFEKLQRMVEDEDRPEEVETDSKSKQGHVIQHTPRTGGAGTFEGDVAASVAPRVDESSKISKGSDLN